jgi:hypothetical protein
MKSAVVGLKSAKKEPKCAKGEEAYEGEQIIRRWDKVR